jgi:hypothetical protein
MKNMTEQFVINEEKQNAIKTFSHVTVQQQGSDENPQVQSKTNVDIPV